jgi:hypothetical protein
VSSHLNGETIKEESGHARHVITDSELATLDIKELNKKLKSTGLSKEDMEKLKAKRRILKNRQYATE